MEETRSITSRESEKARSVEEILNARFDKLQEQMEATLAKQNEQVQQQIKDLMEIMKSNLALASCEANQDQSSTTVVSSPPLHGGKSGTQVKYPAVLTCIDFPRFNGRGMSEWLYKVEIYFDIDRTPEDLKVRLVSIHLDEEAATWHLSIVKSGYGMTQINDWEWYKELLKERFGEVLEEDPMEELKMLKETEGIKHYHEKFELISTKLNMTEDELVSFYLAGLNMEMQMRLRMFQPKTIQHCFFLGRLYEQGHFEKPLVRKQISTNAVASGNQTIKVKGVYNNNVLYFKMVSGSTHNFMDPRVANKLGCFLEDAEMDEVTVGGVRKVKVTGKVNQFEWSFENERFKADMMLIPLSGCDIVLGAEWLKTLGPIIFNFKKLEMQFNVENRKVVLHGIKKGPGKEEVMELGMIFGQTRSAGGL